MNTLTIGQLASASNTGIQTIRYYEREGLLPVPARKASGYRVYRSDTVQRLEFIRRAKTLGFSLSEIGELLSLQDERPGDRARVRELANQKLMQLQSRIQDMQRMEAALAELMRDCSGRGPVKGCPIIETLQAGEK